MAAFAGDSARPMSQFPPLSRDQRRCRLEILHFFGGGGGAAWRSDHDSASRFLLLYLFSPESASLPALRSVGRRRRRNALCNFYFVAFDVVKLEHISFTINIPLVRFYPVPYALSIFFFLNLTYIAHDSP